MPTKRQIGGRKQVKKVTHPVIDVSMNVMEIIALHPDAAGVLDAYGLHCHGCAFNQMDSLEMGARSHGLGDEDIANIAADLNELLKTAPKRPALLTLTTSAAEALRAIAKEEGKTSCLLRVTTDEAGGFCMEFAEKKEKGDKAFEAEGIRDVALIASPEALGRVGGSTVDFREGRFKLDLPKPALGSCDCGKGTCGCGK